MSTSKCARRLGEWTVITLENWYIKQGRQARTLSNSLFLSMREKGSNVSPFEYLFEE